MQETPQNRPVGSHEAASLVRTQHNSPAGIDQSRHHEGTNGKPDE